VLRRQWFNDRNGLSMSPERTCPATYGNPANFLTDHCGLTIPR
jgi:hypothetical protein